MPESRVRIEQVDPRDDAAFRAWSDVVDAVDRHTRPTDPPTSLEERRAFALRGTEPDAEIVVLPLVALDGDRAIGAAAVELPQRDNQHLAEVGVCVLPEARRRGVGSALLAAVERTTAEHGRTTVLGYVDEPPGLLGGSPGRVFAQRHGYAHGQTEVRRDTDLPLDRAVVERLTAECAAHAAGYAVRTWRDRCPDDLVDGMAVLKRTISTDVPLGDMDWHPEVWDAERVRRREELVAAQGRSCFGAIAVHEATGEPVAFTDVGIARTHPERAYQWETLVVGAHRGRRLGMLLKLHCYSAIAEASPVTRYVSTWNAEENAPMIRVNDALGARTNGALSFWQRRSG